MAGLLAVCAYQEQFPLANLARSHARSLHHGKLPAAKRGRGRLYHRYAKELPILDYHCHLPPQQVANDHRFANLAQIWLHGDHYKWRAMRSGGVAEGAYCTGDASD